MTDLVIVQEPATTLTVVENVLTVLDATPPSAVLTLLVAGEQGPPGVNQLSELADVSVVEGAGIDKKALIYDDATGKWLAVPRAYDITVPIVGGMQNGEKVRIAVARPFTLPVGLEGSQFVAAAQATGNTPAVVALKRNTTGIGYLIWGFGATEATVTFYAAITFAVGDVLELDFPATTDPTLVDIGMTFKGSW